MNMSVGEILQKKLGPSLKFNELLAPYVTFKIGGPAQYFYIPKNNQEFVQALQLADELKLKTFILGGGSNLLISDSGFAGFVIKPENRNFKIRGQKVYAESGVLVIDLLDATLAAGLTGWSAVKLLVWWLDSIFLIIIFIYDLKYYLILDQVIIPASLLAFVSNLVLGLTWWPLLLAAAVASGFFLLQYVLSRGQWIGGGDIRLGFYLGLLLGWPGILVALFLAYISGSLIGLSLIGFGRKTMKSRLPFGTFLTAASFLALLYGQPLWAWYWNFLYV